MDQHPPRFRRQRRRFDKVYVAPSSIGQGLFAAIAFPADSAVGRIDGTIHPPGYRSRYCMGFLDGALEPFPPYRFINHSCDPNAILVEWEIPNPEGGDSVFELWLHTLRSVQRGEELTIDYGWDAEAAIPCQCGSPRCRGWICKLEDLDRCLTIHPEKNQSDCH